MGNCCDRIAPIFEDPDAVVLEDQLTGCDSFAAGMNALFCVQLPILFVKAEEEVVCAARERVSPEKLEGL